MSKNNLSDIQCRIRQNADDYRNYVKDLTDWEKEITLKSKSTSVNVEGKFHEPPIRSSIKSSDIPSSTSLKKPSLVNKELAQIAKETGNHYFKLGKFQKSIQYYTNAIDLDPGTSTIYVNRAFAYLKIGKWTNAEEDCTSALELDPKNVKAYWRRSQARQELKLVKEAKADLEKALIFEPANATLREALQTISSATEKPVRRRLEIREIESAVLKPSKPPPTHVSPPKEELTSKLNDITFKIPSLPESLKKWQPPTASYEFDREMKSLTDMGVRRDYLKSIPPNKLPSLFKSSIDTTQLGICIGILYSFMEHHEPANLIYNYLYCLSQCPRFSVIHTLLDSRETEQLSSLFVFLQRGFEGNSVALAKVFTLLSKYGL